MITLLLNNGKGVKVKPRGVTVGEGTKLPQRRPVRSEYARRTCVARHVRRMVARVFVVFPSMEHVWIDD